MRIISLSLIAVILIGILAACGQIGNPLSSDARIQTAIIETSIADATFQAAVYQAAQGTITAIPLPPTITPEPPADPYTLSEEELAGLIDANYEDAIYNSLDASELTQEAASDATVTEDEIYTIVNYVYEAEAAIQYAEELIDLYEDVYGDIANDTLELLIAIEEDLNQLAGSMSEIEAILTQGSVVASETINGLLSLVSTIENQTDLALDSKQAWRDQLSASLNSREKKYSELAPIEIAPDRDGAILQLYLYLDSVKAAFEDQKVTFDEMNAIAQLGANAKASLQQQEGPALQIFSNSIDGFTRQISRGQWAQVRSGIGGFEASLPQRPLR